MRVYIIIMVLFTMAYLPLRWSALEELRRHVGPKFVANYAIPLLVGALIPSALVYFVVVLALFVATTENRMDAACRYILLVSLLPSVEVYLTAGSVSLIALKNADVLAIGLLIVTVMKPGEGARSIRSGIRVEDMLIGLIFVIFWLGQTRAPSLTITLRAAIEQGMLVVLPYVALRRGIRSTEELRSVVACLAFTAVILGFMALYESRMGWAMFDSILDHLNTVTLNRSVYHRGGAMRASTTLAGPLPLALHCVFGFVATLYSRDKIRNNFCFAGWLGMSFLGLMAAQSRGSLLCLVLAALIFFIVRGKWFYASLIGIGAPLSGAVMLFAARFSPKIAAFLNVGEARGEGEVYDYRQLLLQRGLQEASKHRWTGAAMDDVMGRLVDIVQGEGIIDFVNTYLVVYLVSGLAGFIPLAIGFVIVLRKLTGHLSPMVGRALIDMRSFALTAYIVLLVDLAFMSFIDRVPIYMALLLAVSRLVALERDQWRLRRPVPMMMIDDDDEPVIRPGRGRVPA